MARNSMRRILMISRLCAMLWWQCLWAADSLDTWTLRLSPLPSTNWLYSIAYGNDQFVAVGGSPVLVGAGQFGAGAGVLMTSPDGANWVQQTIPNGTGTLLGIAFGAELYVAVTKNRLITWPGVTNWTLTPFVNPFSAAVTHGNDMFVAAFGPSVYISTNGNTWKYVGGPFEFYVKSIACGNGKFVAVGSGMNGHGIISSTNATAWRAAFLSAGVPLSGVSYGSGTFVTVGGDGTIITSTDGNSWTKCTSGTISNLLAVAYGNGVFITVGRGGTLLTSLDGANWKTRDSGTTNDLIAITYGNGHFVAV